jgi:NADPH:quinone reductase-like Zn-dependent oxidoreductase
MSLDHAVSFWIAAPGRGELRREPLPPPAADDVIVQTLFSGVSRGTESLVFRGAVPTSEYQRMRAPVQAGEFPAPVKYGYSSVGRVVGGAPRLRDALVFCLHPHQTQYVVPATAVQRLPGGLPPARAVLAANMETALNGIWDAELRPGDRASVVGAGSLGLLVAWLASRMPGCEVQLVDINPARAAIAQHLGLSFALPDAARREADVVIHASGTQEGLNAALGLAGYEACVTELSWYGDRSVTVSLGGAFHSQRLVLRSSQVGSVAGVQRPRWTHARRLALALKLLREPLLDVLINSEGRFDELPAAMPVLTQAGSDVIMHRVVYDSTD